MGSGVEALQGWERGRRTIVYSQTSLSFPIADAERGLRTLAPWRGRGLLGDGMRAPTPREGVSDRARGPA